MSYLFGSPTHSSKRGRRCRAGDDQCSVTHALVLAPWMKPQTTSDAMVKCFSSLRWHNDFPQMNQQEVCGTHKALPNPSFRWSICTWHEIRVDKRLTSEQCFDTLPFQHFWCPNYCPQSTFTASEIGTVNLKGKQSQTGFWIYAV